MAPARRAPDCLLSVPGRVGSLTGTCPVSMQQGPGFSGLLRMVASRLVNNPRFNSHGPIRSYQGRKSGRRGLIPSPQISRRASHLLRFAWLKLVCSRALPICSSLRPHHSSRYTAASSHRDHAALPWIAEAIPRPRCNQPKRAVTYRFLVCDISDSPYCLLRLRAPVRMLRRKFPPARTRGATLSFLQSRVARTRKIGRNGSSRTA
jgi:hypothetical protein